MQISGSKCLLGERDIADTKDSSASDAWERLFLQPVLFLRAARLCNVPYDTQRDVFAANSAPLSSTCNCCLCFRCVDAEKAQDSDHLECL